MRRIPWRDAKLTFTEVFNPPPIFEEWSTRWQLEVFFCLVHHAEERWHLFLIHGSISKWSFLKFRKTSGALNKFFPGRFSVVTYLKKSGAHRHWCTTTQLSRLRPENASYKHGAFVFFEWPNVMKASAEEISGWKWLGSNSPTISRLRWSMVRSKQCKLTVCWWMLGLEARFQKSFSRWWFKMLFISPLLGEDSHCD